MHCVLLHPSGCVSPDRKQKTRTAQLSPPSAGGPKRMVPRISNHLLFQRFWSLLEEITSAYGEVRFSYFLTLQLALNTPSPCIVTRYQHFRGLYEDFNDCQYVRTSPHILEVWLVQVLSPSLRNCWPLVAAVSGELFFRKGSIGRLPVLWWMAACLCT